ncbi:MAG: hypothetical protein M3R02_30225 [Chloroflexota bacterium]|nr:hypothetical protein [Chloroflexota bacterium]
MSKPTHPLSLEARRLLWSRLWDRLLAPPLVETPPPPGPTRDERPVDPLAAQHEEGQP